MHSEFRWGNLFKADTWKAKKGMGGEHCDGNIETDCEDGGGGWK
jgi:hypothetical protein